MLTASNNSSRYGLDKEQIYFNKAGAERQNGNQRFETPQKPVKIEFSSGNEKVAIYYTNNGPFVVRGGDRVYIGNQEPRSRQKKDKIGLKFNRDNFEVQNTPGEQLKNEIKNLEVGPYSSDFRSIKLPEGLTLNPKEAMLLMENKSNAYESVVRIEMYRNTNESSVNSDPIKNARESLRNFNRARRLKREEYKYTKRLIENAGLNAKDTRKVKQMLKEANQYKEMTNGNCSKNMIIEKYLISLSKPPIKSEQECTRFQIQMEVLAKKYGMENILKHAQTKAEFYVTSTLMDKKIRNDVLAARVRTEQQAREAAARNKAAEQDRNNKAGENFYQRRQQQEQPKPPQQQEQQKPSQQEAKIDNNAEVQAYLDKNKEKINNLGDDTISPETLYKRLSFLFHPDMTRQESSAVQQITAEAFKKINGAKNTSEKVPAEILADKKVIGDIAKALRNQPSTGENNMTQAQRLKAVIDRDNSRIKQREVARQAAKKYREQEARTQNQSNYDNSQRNQGGSQDYNGNQYYGNYYSNQGNNRRAA
ncbi:MAG: hypothetical protein WCJ19_03595 [bacterium]